MANPESRYMSTRQISRYDGRGARLRQQLKVACDRISLVGIVGADGKACPSWLAVEFRERHGACFLQSTADERHGGMSRARGYACTARWNSRLSQSFSTVGLSGKPSKKLNVPRRVSIVSGDAMPGGMGVVILYSCPLIGLAVIAMTPPVIAKVRHGVNQ